MALGMSEHDRELERGNEAEAARRYEPLGSGDEDEEYVSELDEALGEMHILRSRLERLKIAREDIEAEVAALKVCLAELQEENVALIQRNVDLEAIVEGRLKP